MPTRASSRPSSPARRSSLRVLRAGKRQIRCSPHAFGARVRSSPGIVAASGARASTRCGGWASRTDAWPSPPIRISLASRGRVTCGRERFPPASRRPTHRSTGTVRAGRWCSSRSTATARRRRASSSTKRCTWSSRRSFPGRRTPRPRTEARCSTRRVGARSSAKNGGRSRRRCVRTRGSRGSADARVATPFVTHSSSGPRATRRRRRRR